LANISQNSKTQKLIKQSVFLVVVKPWCNIELIWIDMRMTPTWHQNTIWVGNTLKQCHNNAKRLKHQDDIKWWYHKNQWNVCNANKKFKQNIWCLRTNIKNMLTKLKITLQGCQNNVGMLRPCRDNTKMENQDYVGVKAW
jgi:hypothetical protein